MKEGVLRPDAPRISIVVNTLNEEKNLPFCLRSVAPWAFEIVVVDMHSADRTREIAEHFGARVFLHEPMGFSEPARAFAIAQTTGDWVLIVDADELVPRGLAEELQAIVKSNDWDIVQIPRRNYSLGAQLKYTGWGPDQDRHTRFFRKGSLTTTAEIHRFMKPEPGARTKRLPPDATDLTLVHFNYTTFAQFVERLNRYTTIEAKQAFDRGESSSVRESVRVAYREWYRRFVTQKGHRDGWRGAYLALAMAFYRLSTSAKLRELREIGTEKDIAAGYAAVAEELLSQYGSSGVKWPR